jgi:hypothetical protein
MMAARKAGCSGLLLESPEVLQVETETSKLSRETLTITEVKQEGFASTMLRRFPALPHLSQTSSNAQGVRDVITSN